MAEYYVGIDLGTTNTLACYMKQGKPKIVRFSGRDMLPSFLYVKKDGSIVIGEAAKQLGTLDPLNLIRSSKTFMGDFDKVWEIRGK